MSLDEILQETITNFKYKFPEVDSLKIEKITRRYEPEIAKTMLGYIKKMCKKKKVKFRKKITIKKENETNPKTSKQIEQDKQNTSKAVEQIWDYLCCDEVKNMLNMYEPELQKDISRELVIHTEIIKDETEAIQNLQTTKQVVEMYKQPDMIKLLQLNKTRSEKGNKNWYLTRMLRGVNQVTAPTKLLQIFQHPTIAKIEEMQQKNIDRSEAENDKSLLSVSLTDIAENAIKTILNTTNDTKTAITFLEIITKYGSNQFTAQRIQQEVFENQNNGPDDLNKILKNYNSKTFKSIFDKLSGNYKRYLVESVANITRRSPELVTKYLNLINALHNPDATNGISRYFEGPEDLDTKKIIMQRFKTEKFKRLFELIDERWNNELILYTTKLDINEKYLPVKLINIFKKYSVKPKVIKEILNRIQKLNNLTEQPIQDQIIEEISSKRFQQLYAPEYDEAHFASIISSFLNVTTQFPSTKEAMYVMLESSLSTLDKPELANSVDSISDSMEDEQLTTKVIELLSDTTRPINSLAANIYELSEREHKQIVKKYINICDKIKTEELFYTELKEPILKIRNPDDVAIEETEKYKFLELIETEAEYLNQKKAEVIYPLAKILFDVNNQQKEKIKQQKDIILNDLISAYEIARRNTQIVEIAGRDYKQNYLPEFFAGLKQTLDEDCEHLSYWCDTIIEGFSEVAETGQSLSEVMNYGC